MRKTLLALGAVIAVAGATPALANHCPADMAQIDKFVAAHPELPADTLAEARKLRAEGETLHKAGDHAASMAKLDQAKKLLGMGM